MKLIRKIPNVVIQFISHFHHNGFQCYPVGGCVRDLLLKNNPTDYDFTTNASPKEVMKLFHSVIPTGIQHGTVTVLFKGHSFEVTTFRSEASYTDSRHPDRVRFECSLEEDLKRRDFTMNALALDIEKGAIIDLFEGQKDLKTKTIRCIGVPQQRFQEDALRLLRAIRFAAQLQFQIEAQTFQAIVMEADTITKISTERIRDELNKILKSPQPSLGIELMRKSNLLKFILPELLEGVDFEQNEFHKFDVYQHALKACDYLPPSKPLLRLAALLHDIGKPRSFALKEGRRTFYNHEVISAKMAKEILKRLKYSNDEIFLVTFLIEKHMIHYTSQWSDSAIRRFIASVDKEKRDLLFQLKEADAYAHDGLKPSPLLHLEWRSRIEEMEKEKISLHLKDLAVNGNDLMKLGFPANKQLGQILQILLDAVLDDPMMNTKEQLLNLAEGYRREFISPQ